MNVKMKKKNVFFYAKCLWISGVHKWCMWDVLRINDPFRVCTMTCIENIKSTVKVWSCTAICMWNWKLVHCHSHFTSAKVYRSAAEAMSLPPFLSPSFRVCDVYVWFERNTQYRYYFCLSFVVVAVFFPFSYRIKKSQHQMASTVRNSSFQLCVIVWYATMHIYSHLYLWFWWKPNIIGISPIGFFFFVQISVFDGIQYGRNRWLSILCISYATNGIQIPSNRLIWAFV